MSPPPTIPQELQERLKAVTAKRARTVIEHIMEHGFITTEELRQKYGYADPRRAIQDVKDEGIPLERYKVKGTDGRSIGAHRFGDLLLIRAGFSGGRRPFSKAFKAKLLQANGSRCGVCLQEYEGRYLQIDHKIPYQVSGDVAFDGQDAGSYMLVCGSCNRAKSWSCEHCHNFTDLKAPETCGSCYWGSPEIYTHIAMQDARRLDLVWLGKETEDFDRLKAQSVATSKNMPEYVRRVLRDAMSRK